MTQNEPLLTQEKGIAAAILAFTIWGVSPLFYKAIAEATALEILAHRVIWSLLLTGMLIAIQGRMSVLLATLSSHRLMGGLLLSASLVSFNWFVFIWAVTHDRTLDASMGYYLFPLVMVLLGRLFLAETLSGIQLLALCLVTAGVINQLLVLGETPWIALALASSMGFYGLVRKRLQVDALIGLTVECLLLAPAALLYLGYLAHTDLLTFAHVSIHLDLLLAATALMTAIPLLLFTGASRVLRLGSVGMLQYINPSCQFAIAVLLFREPFSTHHMITFSLIWLGLLVYSMDTRKRS